MKLINDCVHGIVRVPPYAEKVINTGIFQRLGRIKQLGCVDKVWPSAVHTRLEHSIGTMHLALQYSDILKFDEKTKRVFALASLLHDIGHGPFSHTFERAIQGTPSGSLFKNHDHYRVALLMGNEELRQVIDHETRCAIRDVWQSSMELLGESDVHPFVLEQLLAGEAGVDRMDYLVRDSYHTSPHRRLDRTCIQAIMYHTEINGVTVAYTDKGKRYLNHLLDERDYLYREVYWHRKALAAEKLLFQAFCSGLEEEVRPLLSVDLYERLDEGMVLQCAWHRGNYAEPLRRFLRNELQ